MYIEKINSPKDLKTLTLEQLTELSSEMRSLLIQKASKCGGHLASNLGVVELTVALHYVFDAPEDKIVFDVSHQTYCHKMLTGRNYAFINPEDYSSISGYTYPKESEYDLFTIGHTSTSISLACGLAKARDLKESKENVVAIIGDSSLDGGQAFEALNYAAELGSGLIVIVNDNDMSIPENHGTLNKKLNELRDNNGHINHNYFESLGFKYVFVRNGHNLSDIIAALDGCKNTNCPVLVHVCTQKGKGYKFAEQDREKFHWARPFDLETGEFLTSVPAENYGAIVREYLLDKMKKDSDVVVMAASTPLCIGFSSQYRKQAGKQFVDVGIAEQNAVSIATGIAKRGGKPVFATNSTFYQRVYDQIAQEMCLGQNAVTMIVTHASVLGHTNDSHAGLFDMALFAHIPYLIYLAPTNKEEYLAMLDWSIDQNEHPVAIRVPWLGVNHTTQPVDNDYSVTKYKVTQNGSKIAILGLGGFYQLAEEAAKLYEEKTGTKPTIVNPRFITGIDPDTLNNLASCHDYIVTLEDGVLSGGFGSKIAQFYSSSSVKVLNYGFPLELPNRYNGREFMAENRLTPELIVEDLLNL